MSQLTEKLPFEKTSVGTSPWRVDGIGLVTGSAKLVTLSRDLRMTSRGTRQVFLKGHVERDRDHVERDKCCIIAK